MILARGVLGYMGVAREVCVCVLSEKKKKEVGGCPRCLLRQSQHSTPQHQSSKSLAPWPLAFNSYRTKTMRPLQVIHQTRLPRFLKLWHPKGSYERSLPMSRSCLLVCSEYDFKVALFADSTPRGFLTIRLLMSRREQWGAVCVCVKGVTPFTVTSTAGGQVLQPQTHLQVFQPFLPEELADDQNPAEGTRGKKPLAACEWSPSNPLRVYSITWQWLAEGMWRNVTSPLRWSNHCIRIWGVTGTNAQMCFLYMRRWTHSSMKQFPTFYKRGIWQAARAYSETQTRHPSK